MAAPAVDPDRSPREVWIVSAVAMLGAVMSILDTTIVNVALATLGKDLHSTLSSIQWVITGYMLSLAAVIPVTGWASRRFGAKRVFLISLVLFTLGSLLCGLATIDHRIDPLPRAAGRRRRHHHAARADHHGRRRRSQADGPRDGPRRRADDARPDARPAAGGTIIEALNWHWIFFVNLSSGRSRSRSASGCCPAKTGARTDTSTSSALC